MKELEVTIERGYRVNEINDRTVVLKGTGLYISDDFDNTGRLEIFDAKDNPIAGFAAGSWYSWKAVK